jgi:hypothetical protein
VFELTEAQNLLNFVRDAVQRGCETLQKSRAKHADLAAIGTLASLSTAVTANSLFTSLELHTYTYLAH